MPFAGLLTVGAISAGTSILGGILGHKAAKTAAEVQAAAAEKANANAGVRTTNANDIIAKGVGDANDTLSGFYKKNLDLLQPYIGAGDTAVHDLSTQAPFQAPTEINDPGYAFRIAEGMKQLNNTIAGKGGALSGSAIKSGQRFAQGTAEQAYGNDFTRAKSVYDTNTGVKQNLAQLGLSATDTGVGVGADTARVTSGNIVAGAGQQSNNLMNLSQLEGENITGAGNARASGYVGAANADEAALGGLGKAATDAYGLYTLKDLLKKAA